MSKEENKDLSQEFLQLSRLALAGRRQDVQMYIRRLAKKLNADLPHVAEHLHVLLREAPDATNPLRGVSAAATPMPVDLDSRLHLARVEQHIKLPYEPIWSPSIGDKLDQLVSERKNQSKLLKANICPSKAILFTGPPGVGKTLAARSIAAKLGLPLVVLDLSAVMSRFLGKTGNNLRNVLDYAKSVNCVFLLDEFDSIAKKRNDDTEVGELKRIVTVLLQEIDDWPSTGLLIAATNHPELLDPAVWRRFDLIVEFDLPQQNQISQALEEFLGADLKNINAHSLQILYAMCAGLSFSDIEKRVQIIKRRAILNEISLEEAILNMMQSSAANLSKVKRIEMAETLKKANMSDREVSRLIGISRDTIRKKRTEA